MFANTIINGGVTNDSGVSNPSLVHFPRLPTLQLQATIAWNDAAAGKTNKGKKIFIFRHELCSAVLVYLNN